MGLYSPLEAAPAAARARVAVLVPAAASHPIAAAKQEAKLHEELDRVLW